MKNMIIRYTDFIKENSEKLLTPEDYGIEKYEWSDGYLNCSQDVKLFSRDLIKIPFRFGKVEGFFDCSDNYRLESLEGSPVEVTGGFFCNDTRVPRLVGCPKLVGGSFWDDKYLSRDITEYPLCIIYGRYETDNFYFKKIFKLVKANIDKFIPLVNNKVAFHQQIMRIEPAMVKWYVDTKIPIPSRKTII